MRTLPLDHPGTADVSSPDRFLWWMARGQWPTLLGGMFFGIIWASSHALMPLVLGRAIDHGVASQDASALVQYAGLMLLARAGEGSMRDSLSAFDQVRAFAGDQIEVDDVVTVLGLIGRDLVLDMLDAVAAEDAPAAFALVERAIERGYDLRLLCRELARATRDHPELSVGASPRAVEQMGDASRAYAMLDGRDYVLPDDVKALAEPVFGHRLVTTTDARIRDRHVDEILREVLRSVPVPTELEP